MKIRIQLFAVLLLMALVIAPTQVSAGGDRSVFMRFAGDFIQNLEQTDVDEYGMPIGTSNLGIIRGKAKGNLGSADVTAVTKAENVEPVFDSRCPEGFLKVANITDNSLVITFSDLSLLYGDGQGFVCVNFANGDEYSAIEGIWLGGTARFRDAEGEFLINIDEFVRVNPNTQIIAESGTITGTISYGK